MGCLGEKLEFYTGKTVLITGHTGFKGSWLSQILIDAGANVVGYSLNPQTKPALFELLNLESKMQSVIGDIRDLEHLMEVFNAVNPEIVFHLAAQPLVIDSYDNPHYTYETNVMGTVNILECIRKSKSVKSFLNVTTDKVYENKEWIWGYREVDELNGYDPYSNSKSCSELVTSSYIKSFFNKSEIAVSTARAGNVIGGGDFSANRIIPDCVDAALKNQKIIVRNPNSVRPYQHVLEPLSVYLEIAEKQYLNKELYAGSYNVGPNDNDCLTTGDLATKFCQSWGEEVKWETKDVNGPHEANFLKLDCSLVKSKFDWKPRWTVNDAISKTVEWSKCYGQNDNVSVITSKQIKDFYNLK